jgi:hypothetical protein
MSPRSDRSTQPSTSIHLTLREIRILVRLANYYLSIRPLRFLMRFTAPRDIRSRIRFIAEESAALKAVAEAARDSMRDAGLQEGPVTFTLPTLIGFWGRTLASINTPRSRRKLSQDEYDARTALAHHLEEATRSLLKKSRWQIEDQLETRRPVEQVWMRERLNLPHKHIPDTESTGT